MPNEPDAARIARLRAADAEAEKALREQIRTGGPEQRAAVARAIEIVGSLDQAGIDRMLKLSEEELVQLL